ncbi:1-aminocyclopropane-1-carboxylate deaminase [Burkholderia arboris]|uniref:1-aminocyclopropane-1-carboxylate deaminase n=1 Tax=Burkholderia arboris TaxID=488730 RepID=A0A9Q9SI08_9BURK|nr:1-aminocyclopropane-1-carboxylate deaminase [Burkholderia arboris]
MQEMTDTVPRGEFEPGSKVLYAQSGGVPASSAYAEIFRNG